MELHMLFAQVDAVRFSFIIKITICFLHFFSLSVSYFLSQDNRSAPLASADSGGNVFPFLNCYVFRYRRWISTNRLCFAFFCLLKAWGFVSQTLFVYCSHRLCRNKHYLSEEGTFVSYRPEKWKITHVKRKVQGATSYCIFPVPDDIVEPWYVSSAMGNTQKRTGGEVGLPLSWWRLLQRRNSVTVEVGACVCVHGRLLV